jgi:hypothetical protein
LASSTYEAGLVFQGLHHGANGSAKAFGVGDDQHPNCTKEAEGYDLSHEAFH